MVPLVMQQKLALSWMSGMDILDKGSIWVDHGIAHH